MKKFLALVLAVALVLGLSLSLVACNKTPDIDQRDYITVGLECGYAPYNWTQTDSSNGAVKIDNANGYANGYDVMIAKKIAEEFGKELKIVKYDWDALIPAVTSGALDFIIAGMSPTEERKQSIDFSDVYYRSKLVVVVRKDGAYKDAANLDGLSGAAIVAQLGTFHDDALQSQASLHGIIARTPMDTFPMMINALKTGAIDGYVAEEPGAIADCAANSEFTYLHIENNTTGFSASDDDTAIAIGTKKNSKHLATVNAALAKISEQDRINMMNNATEWSVNAVEDED